MPAAERRAASEAFSATTRDAIERYGLSVLDIVGGRLGNAVLVPARFVPAESTF
jgi:hypothetical protein